jgi:hypothetical protein
LSKAFEKQRFANQLVEVYQKNENIDYTKKIKKLRDRSRTLAVDQAESLGDTTQDEAEDPSLQKQPIPGSPNVQIG